eukprot:SAG31_NODE_394_length_16282_cov_132.890564_16_plen_95_part_00
MSVSTGSECSSPRACRFCGGSAAGCRNAASSARAGAATSPSNVASAVAAVVTVARSSGIIHIMTDKADVVPVNLSRFQKSDTSFKSDSRFGTIW